MSVNIDPSFIKHYAAEVHQSYQRMGSKLRGMVRVQNNVKGATAVFQTVGKGTAATKGRHGQVPVMNISHRPVECRLEDFYAGDWVDKLDTLKVGHDERGVVVNAGAYALGRKTDELIIKKLDDSRNFAGVATGGLTKAKVLAAFEKLGDADVPDDGQRYAVIGWKQWSDLLDIQEFANADYIGQDELPWKGTQAKRWLGTLWAPHSGLSKSSDGTRLCHWFHKTAIGHGSGADVKSDITWHGDRAAFFVANMMSQGSCLIDEAGVVTLRCKE